MWVIFVVSCIPIIRPLFAKVFQEGSRSSSRHFGASSGYIENQASANTGPYFRTRAFSSSYPLEFHNETRNNESEENILPSEKGILMTSLIIVKSGKGGEQSVTKKQYWETGTEIVGAV